MPLDAAELADIIASGIEAAVTPLLARLAVLEARQMTPGLTGPAGRDGKDGLTGRDGKDGAPGRDGKDGADGLHGKDGAPGRDGKDGADGLHGKDGAPGRDGTLEELSITWVDDRTIRFTRADGTVLSERQLPITLYRGIFDASRVYDAGDQVTCAGSMWIAKTTTTQRPDDDGPGARDWQLCAKRGPLGPRGPKGDPGTPGKDGAPGRDLTQMDTQGRKW